MVKYHINSKGEKAVCHATNRACRFTPVEDITKNDEVVEFFNPSPSPVVVPPLKFSVPRTVDLGYIENLDWDYDSYEEPEGQETDYGRNRVYDNLRITSVPQARDTLAHVLNVEPKDVPDPLVEETKKAGIEDRFLGFEIYADSGYYGEEKTIDVSKPVSDIINKWYYSHDNATDQNRILNYLRRRGMSTEGLSPVEAIKQKVKTEKNGKIPADFQRSDKIWIKNKVPKNIVVPNQDKLNKVTSRNPLPLDSKTNRKRKELSATGILFYDPKTKEYILVSGYEEHKEALKTPSKQRKYVITSYQYSDRNDMWSWGEA